jgi:polyisoprenoid-binding protein YceI
VKTVIYGDLTIKDKTNPIQFPATVQYENNQVRAVANFAIDRQLWNLTMWNGVVNDYLQFEIDLTRTPAL